MPIIFHYSQDLGLLERRICDFQNLYSSAKIYRTLSIPDLDLLFSPNTETLEDSHHNLILFITPSFFSPLSVLFSSLKIELFNVLLVCHSESLSVPDNLRQYLSNEDYRLDKLTHVTKKGFINKLINSSPHVFQKDIISLIKEKIPPNLSFIETIFQNIVDLKNSNSLTLSAVNTLLSSMSIEENYFEFFNKYISQPHHVWLIFVNKNIGNQEEYNKFFYSLGFKILEFKRFLSVKDEFKTADKITLKLQISRYIVGDYFRLLNMFGDKLEDWFEKFTLDFYFFERTLVHSIPVNLSLIKLFLLKQKENLI